MLIAFTNKGQHMLVTYSYSLTCFIKTNNLSCVKTCATVIVPPQFSWVFKLAWNKYVALKQSVKKCLICVCMYLSYDTHNMSEEYLEQLWTMKYVVSQMV